MLEKLALASVRGLRGIWWKFSSLLAERKRNWIDFDAGKVLTEGLDVVADRLLANVQRIASGAVTAAERNGEREIAIWKRGVTL